MSDLTKLRFSGQSGLTAGAAIRDLENNIWNGTSFVVQAAAQWTYAPSVPVPEPFSDGFYSTNIPNGIIAGKYFITYIDLTSTDVIEQAHIEWDGTSVVDDLVTGSSTADICNLALSHLGVGKEIANLTSDDSQEAYALRRFYETVLNKTLRSFPWPFALRSVALALVAEDPTPEWGFSYRYPTNALYVRRIKSGIRNDTRQSQVPSRVGGDDSGRLIYTDAEDAVIEYVAKVTNPLRFTPDFIMAFSLLLAHYIAPRLSQSDSKLGERAFALYTREIDEAKALAANEEQAEEAPESEFIRERD